VQYKAGIPRRRHRHPREDRRQDVGVVAVECELKQYSFERTDRKALQTRATYRFTALANNSWKNVTSYSRQVCSLAVPCTMHTPHRLVYSTSKHRDVPKGTNAASATKNSSSSDVSCYVTAAHDDQQSQCPDSCEQLTLEKELRQRQVRRV